MAHIAKSTGKPDKRMRERPPGVDAIGRPEKVIDWDRVDSLLIAGCLGTEVASYFDMHPNTFYDKVLEKKGICFTEYSAKKKQTGESLLREQQYAKAIGASKEGDNTLLIWLGKQRLNQSETPNEGNVSEQALTGLTALLSQLDKFHKKTEDKTHEHPATGEQSSH